jgi:hypothetical protein
LFCVQASRAEIVRTPGRHRACIRALTQHRRSARRGRFRRARRSRNSGQGRRIRSSLCNLLDVVGVTDIEYHPHQSKHRRQSQGYDDCDIASDASFSTFSRQGNFIHELRIVSVRPRGKTEFGKHRTSSFMPHEPILNLKYWYYVRIYFADENPLTAMMPPQKRQSGYCHALLESRRWKPIPRV